MKLNHLNLTVPNPGETAEFLIKYFGLKARGKLNSRLNILSDDNGMVFTLMSPEFTGGRDVRYPGAFHIGFVQESEEQVNEINARLKADGFDVPAPSKQHGSWTFYFTMPGGVMVEVQA